MNKISNAEDQPKPVSHLKPLPCPFCGAKAIIIPMAPWNDYSGKCCECYASTGGYEEAADALNAWNMRVQTTNNLPSKDNVSTPKNEVLQPEDKPEPVSYVMPENLIKFFFETGNGNSIPADLFHDVFTTVAAAYQRIADLEEELLEIRPTPWAYEQVCKALEVHKHELTQLKAQIAAMREAGLELCYEIESNKPELGWRNWLDKIIADWKAASTNQDPRPAPGGE